MDQTAIWSGVGGVAATVALLFPVVRRTIAADAVMREDSLRASIKTLEEEGDRREREYKERDARRDEEFRGLSAEMMKLKTENDLLKRFASFEEIPTTLKLYMDRMHSDQMGVLNAMRTMMEGFGAMMNRIAEGLKS